MLAIVIVEEKSSLSLLHELISAFNLSFLIAKLCGIARPILTFMHTLRHITCSIVVKPRVKFLKPHTQFSSSLCCILKPC